MAIESKNHRCQFASIQGNVKCFNYLTLMSTFHSLSIQGLPFVRRFFEIQDFECRHKKDERINYGTTESGFQTSSESGHEAQSQNGKYRRFLRSDNDFHLHF